MNTEPIWIQDARTFLNLREVKGEQHSAQILQMWKDIKRSGIKDDETPWCAAFVGSILERNLIRSTRFESAKSYLAWGTALAAPAVGCVVVFSRNGGGHVGFCIGQTASGNLLILGGNQDDSVSIREFKRSAVSPNGFRWPLGVEQPMLQLPILLSAAESKSVV